jgi:hypothetical protein
MKCFILPLILVVFLFSCGKKETFKPRNFLKVEIEILLKDSLLSIRAIDIMNDNSLAFCCK